MLTVGVCVPVADRLTEPAVTVAPSPTKALTPPPVLADTFMALTLTRPTLTALLLAVDVAVPTAVSDAAPLPSVTLALLPMRAFVVCVRVDWVLEPSPPASEKPTRRVSAVEVAVPVAVPVSDAAVSWPLSATPTVVEPARLAWTSSTVMLRPLTVTLEFRAVE